MDLRYNQREKIILIILPQICLRLISKRHNFNYMLYTATVKHIDDFNKPFVAGKAMFIMIRTIINGFFMALADSVPGVSGGTIALIMGFYDNFIGSINKVIYGKMQEKKRE